mgnify:CR=1 FL=1|jgi:hypothetical protein|tara:strand:- start:509 stop:724 length:216 start_codon:yes stop_codon:yes gene_type:complete
MKANEIYVAKANDLYAAIGHAMVQKKQLEEQLADLEAQLKGLIIHNPLLQKVEQDTLDSLSKDEEEEDGEL